MNTLDPLHFDAETPRYDWLVITASNDNQAANYREQLAWRKPDDDSGCDIPGFRRVLVVPDPQGKRAGSGGSTFAVIFELAQAMLKERPHARTLEDLLGDQHVLILHSGGDARRLPPYAPQGKIFIPVPGISEDGRPLTLFDRVLGDFYSLPRPAGARLIIGAGDLLLHLDFDRPILDAPGVVGVAADSPPDRGTRHGVYVTNAQGHVTGFLQKPTLGAMQSAHAISSAGSIQVDTGVLSIDWNSITRWMDSLGLKIDNCKLLTTGLLADILAARAGTIDLYEHILCLLAPEGSAPSLPASTSAAIKKAISGTPFQAARLKKSTFYHMGTSHELIEFGTKQNWGVFFSISEDNVAILSSTLDASRAYSNSFIENCDIRCPLRLDGMNVVVNVPSEATRPLRLDRGACAVWFPIDDDKWTLIRYPLDFDWKTTDVAAILKLLAGPRGFDTFAMKKPQTLLGAITPEQGELTAFHARLWNVGAMKELESLAARFRHQDMRAHRVAVNDWLNADRIALADLPKRANLARIREMHSHNTGNWLSHHAYETLRACPRYPTARILEICAQYPEHGKSWIAAARQFEEFPNPSLRARGARLASVLESNSTDIPWSVPVSKAVASCVSGLTPAQNPPPKAQQVTVALPARIDLAGGWSDTPPICNDSGGLVINISVRLQGPPPVSVTLRRTSDRTLVIRSIDQNQRIELPLAQPLQLTDTSDWSSLARAAILYTLLPSSTEAPIEDFISSGLEISFQSTVPKGSGLGTSSILAAALVTALNRLLVSEDVIDLHDACRRVSTIEQAIGSCGGWQDQYGALVPGLKALQTFPGFDQSAIVTRFSMDSRIGELLGQRTLLYYTGQQRLAANILQRFVSRYLDRDPRTLRVIRGIQSTARDLFTALERDDPNAFVHQVTRYWHYKRQIDPSASNATIESIIESASPDLSGHLLPGAGGGGFLLFFANSTAAKQNIIDRLTTNPPNKEARFYDLKIDESGPQITVEH